MILSLQKTWIPLLSLFFLWLIIYQIFLPPLLEGLENATDYKDYNTNDPNNALILSQQNAGNIAYLKDKLDELSSLKATVMDNCGNIVELNNQMLTIMQQQAGATQQINDLTTPNISGLT